MADEKTAQVQHGGLVKVVPLSEVAYWVDCGFTVIPGSADAERKKPVRKKKAADKKPKIDPGAEAQAS